MREKLKCRAENREKKTKTQKELCDAEGTEGEI
jgi:hypothetical protein